METFVVFSCIGEMFAYADCTFSCIDRSMSMCTDTSALQEYLCTLIQNGHEYCKLFIKRPQTVMFSNYAQENKC